MAGSPASACKNYKEVRALIGRFCMQCSRHDSPLAERNAWRSFAGQCWRASRATRPVRYGSCGGRDSKNRAKAVPACRQQDTRGTPAKRQGMATCARCCRCGRRHRMPCHPRGRRRAAISGRIAKCSRRDHTGVSAVSEPERAQRRCARTLPTRRTPCRKDRPLRMTMTMTMNTAAARCPRWTCACARWNRCWWRRVTSTPPRWTS